MEISDYHQKNRASGVLAVRERERAAIIFIIITITVRRRRRERTTSVDHRLRIGFHRTQHKPKEKIQFKCIIMQSIGMHARPNAYNFIKCIFI